MRPTYAEIDLAAIRHNVAAIAAEIAPADLCAVVKADGYGHGDAPVANAALEAGASMVAVALVEEGVRLREAGIEAPILVLSEPDPGSGGDLRRWRLTPAAYTQEGIQWMSEAIPGAGIHLKVDTGMHRVGAPPESFADLFGTATASGLEVEGLWTHFAVADEDPGFTRSQIATFDEVTAGLDAPVTHLANTAGALLFPDARRSLCRVGIGIYGLHPTPATAEVVGLRPAMRVVTRVTSVRRLPAGSRPSYGRIRELERDSTVATAPIGYADGFTRLLSGSGSVLIGERRFPLAGTVTMDQIVIDVGDHEVDLGEEVVVLGSQGGESVTADEWAGLLGTISYEVVCGIGPRVPRRYLP